MEYGMKMSRKFYLVAVAGGSGTRMGAAVPKQFLELGGKAILQRTIESFVRACPETHVITVLPQSCIGYWKDYCLERNFDIPQTIVAGGLTRYHSVLSALSKIPDGAVVAVHDGVRPLVSESLIRTMLDRMKDVRALIPVLPSVDTLTVLCADRDGLLQDVPGESVDRSRIFRVQTPQMFLSEDLKRAYAGAFDISYTDDASVARANKIPLSYIEGERFNIKITTPQDLQLARAIMDIEGIL